MFTEWQLQQAKNKLSQVIKQAQQGTPQYITVHGQPVVVVLSVKDYRQLTRSQTKLSEVLSAPDIAGEDLEFEHDEGIARKIDW